VLGQPMKSATEVRAQFAAADEETKKQIIQDLFGGYSDDVYELMSGKILESSQQGTDHRRVFGGLDGDIKDMTQKLKDLLVKVKNAPTGTKVRQRFVISFHQVIASLKQQMAASIEIKESQATLKNESKLTDFDERLSENTINNTMTAQKLGIFTKGKNKVSLWEHNGVSLIVHHKSNSIQEAGTITKAVDALYANGYICESSNFKYGDDGGIKKSCANESYSTQSADRIIVSYDVHWDDEKHSIKLRDLGQSDEEAIKAVHGLVGGRNHTIQRTADQELMASRKTPRYGYEKTS
jgi:hypothetical protein